MTGRRDGLARIVCGGQTGVDRAALDVASELGLARGGWCPRGRRAEDGAIHPGYPLRETPLAAYAQRTAWNVRDSDATLVLLRGHATGGTRATLRAARWRRRPCRVVVLDRRSRADETARWLVVHRVRVLNVAGPRESESPGIHDAAGGFLRRLFRAVGD